MVGMQTWDDVPTYSKISFVIRRTDWPCRSMATAMLTDHVLKKKTTCNFDEISEFVGCLLTILKIDCIELPNQIITNYNTY